MGLRNLIKISDKELYTKINSLHFTDEVVLTKVKGSTSIGKVISSINRNQKIVEKTEFGDKILLKRIRPFNMNIRCYKK